MEKWLKKATPEEVKADTQRAEGTMSRTQRELSQNRERRVRKLEELGMTGHLEASTTKENGDPRTFRTTTDKIEGVLNGEAISFSSKTTQIKAGAYPEFKHEYEGTVDGRPLEPQEVQKRFEKYLEKGIVQFDEERKKIEGASQEVRNLGYNKTREDQVTKLSQEIKDRM